MMDEKLASVYQAYDAVSRVLAAHGAQAAKAAQDRQQAHQQLEVQIATKKASDGASHEAAMKDAAAQQDAFEREKSRMGKIFEQQQEKVKLDVGGQRFSTSMTTLLSIPESIFTSLFTGDDAIEMDEDDGSYFIDRDGRQFHFILDYLRAPDEFQLPTDPVIMKELAKEIEYYQVPIGGPTAAEKAAMEKAAAEAAAAEAATAAHRAAAAERQRQELEAQQEQQRQQLAAQQQAAQQQAEEQRQFAEAQRRRQVEEQQRAQAAAVAEQQRAQAAAVAEQQRAQAAASAAASAGYNPSAAVAAPTSAAGPAAAGTPSAAAFFNAAAAPAPVAAAAPPAVPAPFVPTPAPAMFNPAAAQAPAPAHTQTHSFVPTPVLATIPSAMLAPPTGPPPATDPRDMHQPLPPAMAPPVHQNPSHMQGPPSVGAPYVPVASAPASVPGGAAAAAANTADPTGMTFGSKQLDGMSIRPLSQADHNTRRGWNDVPTNLTPKKKIVPVQAPIMSPMFQPGAAASGNLGGPPPAFNPGAFQPGPPPSGGGGGGGAFQPGPPPTSQPAATAPAHAPAPIAAAAAPAPAQLSPAAQALSDKFAKVISACRTGRTNLTAKVDGAAKRLDPYYAAISCDGSYDQRVQTEMNQLADMLLAGQARPALTKIGSLIQGGDGSGTFGQGLLSVKNLAGVVERFIKANNGWPAL